MQNYRKTALIYNPRAGGLLRGGGTVILRTAEVLSEQGHNVTLVPTTGPRTAGALAASQIGQGADLILVAGGDGTINEAIGGIVGSTVPLGVLPGGTANVLAMEMRIGRNPVEAARRLTQAKPQRISIGNIALEGDPERYFLLLAGIGLDAHVVYNVNAALKARTGKFAYWVAGWSTVGRQLPQFEAVVDGKPHTCSFALVSKVRNYGGDFEIARSVTLLDDTFEIVLFEGKTTIPFIRYFIGMATGRLAGMRGVTVLRGKDVMIHAAADERVHIQIDGEHLGQPPARVHIVPGAISLLVPPEYGKQ